MNDKSNNLIISRVLQKWYAIHKRDLPWRENSDAYRVWISEIILQQTRVTQGLPYFLRFMENFPDVHSLAIAPEEKVLKLWQGLGYYSRARNLHAAAKQIVSDFNGVFPREYPDVLSLKGVGAYTAAAITSIAYNQPYAVIDGNVDRVLSRLFAINEAVNSAKGKKMIREIADDIIDPENPGTHNQAIMDFGAMICTPATPQCGECPLQGFCIAFERNEVKEYPIKNRQKTVRHRYFNYFHIEVSDKTYIRERKGSDIWKNLYEFPLIETEEKKDLAELQVLPAFKELFSDARKPSFQHRANLKHVLSHQIIHADFYHVSFPRNYLNEEFGDAIEISQNTLQDFAVSRLTHKYLEKITD